MDRQLQIALVSALIAAILGYGLQGGLRAQSFELKPLAHIIRSELPAMFWLIAGFLAISIAVMAGISLDALLGLL